MPVLVSPGLQSALGINGLNPSAITSPNIPQTLFSTIIPLGVVGPSGAGELSCGPVGPGAGVTPPHTNAEVTVSVFPTQYVAGTVQLLNLDVNWRNIIGEMVEQHNQVYFYVTAP